MNAEPLSSIVSAGSLTRRYGAETAVDNVSFDIAEGEIFGLIGPDGAGKTTIFHMMGGILDPTGGTLSVLGLAPAEARLQIGYLTQQFSLYSDLSVEENMRYAAGLRNVTRLDFQERSTKYLRLMDLERFSDRLAGNLSGGMKQKLALCCALISRPRVLLLDEPTTGVDPVSRRDFWDVLNTISHEGVTVAVATPYLDEAERCTRIALIHEGRIRDIGSPGELKDSLNLMRLELRSENVESLEQIVRSLEVSHPQMIADVQRFGDRLDALVKATNVGRGSTGRAGSADAAEGESAGRAASADAAAKLISEAAAENGMEATIELQSPTLENVFVIGLRSKTSEIAGKPFRFTRRADNRGTAIGAERVSKRFGSFQAVKDVNLSVEYGQIYGLLGANGAGKTTTIKMLCGLIEPSAGELMLAGKKRDLRDRRLRQTIGYMSQKFTLYQDLTVIENLRYYAGVYGVPLELEKERVAWAIESCGLSGNENELTGDLPGGYRQRLAFGATVMHEPTIIFLDEPTSGVDPIARRELWKLIRQFAGHGTAILVTTHFLEEAEHCHRLGFMAAGEVVADGSPDEIRSEQQGMLLELRTSDNQRAKAVLIEEVPAWRISIFADTLHLVVEKESETAAFSALLEGGGIQVESQRIIPFSLEDAFIGIVERARLEAAA